LIEPIDITAVSKQHILRIKREDLLHPFVSGNKFRKLKYQLEKIKEGANETALTFGGAFSNHIAAVAAAGKLNSFKTIGVIRGEELENQPLNATLGFAKSQGMKLHFVKREVYRSKTDTDYLAQLKEKFGPFYVIPEGGTNELAVKGCEEIITNDHAEYDYICVAVGTGGTLAGIVKSLQPHQSAIGFSVLKGTFQAEVVQKFTSNQNYKIIDSYNFGGYAKIDSDLIRFINEFKENQNIQLDPVYTGKMFYGIFDLLKQGMFKKNSRIFAIHTGGLQGISGMNEKLKKKKLPLIDQ
jgi:1-aminocyclopropane-1-carboxylate deaminase